MVTRHWDRLLGAFACIFMLCPAHAQTCDGTWSSLGSGVNNRVRAIAAFDDGSGLAIYAGGEFTQAGGGPVNSIARWDGGSWSPLGSGLTEGAFSSTATVYSLIEFDDGSGPALYAGGDFRQAGGTSANRVARWDGSSWSPVGAGLGPDTAGGGRVRALTVFDDGSGPTLYAAGLFSVSGGDSIRNIARWNGASWSPLGVGLGGSVYALAVYDDGQGPALYAAGAIFEAGGSPVNRIARWDGLSWSPLGSGIGNEVFALAAFDDGTTSSLYAGGLFLDPANMIARWDGASWSGLGSVITNTVRGLAVFNDGSGPALYAAGFFSVLLNGGPEFLSGIGRWDGTAWSPLGVGLSGTGFPVYTLIALNDDSGPALYVGGEFTQAGGNPANRIAKWKGCGIFRDRFEN